MGPVQANRELETGVTLAALTAKHDAGLNPARGRGILAVSPNTLKLRDLAQFSKDFRHWKMEEHFRVGVVPAQRATFLNRNSQRRI